MLGAVAQLGEHLLCKQGVRSSSLLSSTTLYMKGNFIQSLYKLTIITSYYLNNYLNPTLQYVVDVIGC